MSEIFDLKELIRPDLKGLQPYETHYAPDLVRLDANENPYDFPPEVREYIFSRLGPQFFGRYPDPLARDLVSDLAGRFGLDSENIMAGSGSDEIILDLMLAFGVGKKVFIATPTFSMYGIHARVAGALSVEVPRGPDFGLDLEALKAAGAADPGLMVICNPNNPTGNASDPAEIEAVVSSVRSLVVVDEAYIEFGGESCLPLLARYPNLAVLRTFSKAYGLAGLRVGYLLAGREVIREILRVKQPFNLNSFSQLAAQSAIHFSPLFENRIREIIGERERLFQRLKDLPGITAYPSQANFIFFSAGRPAREVYTRLQERGVLVRYLEIPGRGGFLRVSVGTAGENDAFIDGLRRILQEGD